MADIAMCDDKECPARDECYRFKATPDPHRQTYLVSPREPGAESCKELWPVHSRSQLRRLDILNQ